MGKFSIDRTVREYTRDIWKAPFIPVPLPETEAVHASLQ
jgi:hypothetical protein